MIRIPDYMFRRLIHIQTHFPEAVIAGGALRDLYFNRPIKDVDVFVSSLGKDPRTLVASLFPENFFSGPTVYETIPAEIADYAEFAARDNLRGVWQVMDDSGNPPFQIIAMDTPVDVWSMARRCDFGFCQAATDGYLVHQTDRFWRDADQKTATYVGPYDPVQIARSRRRAERLKPRYPDFTFVFPVFSDPTPLVAGMAGTL